MSGLLSVRPGRRSSLNFMQWESAVGFSASDQSIPSVWFLHRRRLDLLPGRQRSAHTGPQEIVAGGKKRPYKKTLETDETLFIPFILFG
jgi:hypothetical protein